MKFRYFITDNSHIGTLIMGNIAPEIMLIYLGKLLFEGYTISRIVNTLVSEYRFIIESENLSFKKLNTDPEYAYTYYDLISEGVSEKDSYLYCNTKKIKQHFSDSQCKKMLKSIDLISLKKDYFLESKI